MYASEDAPTLLDVVVVYGEATAIAWLNIELDSVDCIQGAQAFGDGARRDAAQLILARYKNVAVPALLVFFANYKLGEYFDATKGVGGVQKVLVALRLFNNRALDEANAIYHKRMLEYEHQRRMAYERT